MSSSQPQAPFPRVLIADDHPVFRNGLRLVLGQDGFAVVGEAGSGDEALAQMAELRPAAVILDVTMPGTPSTTVAKRILADWPGTVVIVLTMHDNPSYLRDFLRIGVHGFVLKKSTSTELAQALRAALGGRRYIDPALAGQVVRSPEPPAVTCPAPTRELISAREREVASLLIRGLTNVEIAGCLHLSPRTVESHRASLQRKLGVTTRAALVRWAAEAGLFDDGPVAR